MTPFLKKLVFIALIFETLLFLMLYYFGPNGIHILTNLRSQQESLLQEIVQIRTDIVQLEKQVVQSQTDFEKEKIARERLLMKKDNETVYFKK